MNRVERTANRIWSLGQSMKEVWGGRTIPALWNHDPYACSDLLISDHPVGARTRSQENEGRHRKWTYTYSASIDCCSAILGSPPAMIKCLFATCLQPVKSQVGTGGAVPVGIPPGIEA